MKRCEKNSEKFKEELDAFLGSGYPLIAIQTSEEKRVDELIYEVARVLGKKVFHWSEVIGNVKQIITEANGTRERPKFGDDKYTTGMALLEHLHLKADSYSDKAEGCVFVLKDFNPHFRHPRSQRYLRELAPKLKSNWQNIIFTSPSVDIPIELSKDITRTELPLPTRTELNEVLTMLVEDVKKGSPEVEMPVGEDLDRVLDAASGLTTIQAEDAFSKSLRVKGKFSANEIVITKRLQIAQTGILEFYQPDVNLSGVGGFDNLKEWLAVRAAAFTEEARSYGLVSPKGILINGVPGTGKSLMAKAVGCEWGLPVLRLDLGKVYGSLVGESEKNLREAISVTEAVAPCILWIDEIEKGLAGASSSGKTDSGVTARVFGTLLTWMQEKASDVMVIATANNIKGIPPEFTRKGRFDELFWVDLPTPSEREEILKIHLTKKMSKENKSRKLKNFDLKKLIAATPKFTGSEIEEAINSAMFQAFSDKKGKREFTTEDIVDIAKKSVPIAKSMKEVIAENIKWANERAIKVSSSNDVEAEDESETVNRKVSIKKERTH